MFSEVRKRTQKAGLPPGTPVYTGHHKNVVPKVTVVVYSPSYFYEKSGMSLDVCMPNDKPDQAVTWINIEGLHDIDLIQSVAKRYELHPLTVEDILNVEQRSKVEEFETYIFITLKVLLWDPKKKNCSISELDVVLGDGLVITFQDLPSSMFNAIVDRIRASAQQNLRKKSSDYLVYRLIDSVVDQYFFVLEGLGEQIEKIEDTVIVNPTKQSAKTIYRLKRQILQIRKAIWPAREIINHLLKVDESFISSFTHVYLRDVYDHTVQSIDTVETFREMLSNLLDVYLSSLTNRMNEVMKVLTIIATTFIPVTFLASIYGMNFIHMPELQWRWGYPAVLLVMVTSIASMLYYFRRKKWW